jgi:ATP-dependent DNA helicase RecG
MTNSAKKNNSTINKSAPVLQDLKGLGKKLEETLTKLNIHCFEDLLFHFPFRYEDRTRITPISRLRLKQLVVVDAEIISSKLLYGKRRSLSIGIRDASSVCFIRLFHFNKSQAKQLAEGSFIRIIGEPRLGSQGLEFYHPEYRLFKDTPPPLEKNLTPVYASCEGLSSNRISQLILQALQLLEKFPQKSLLPQQFNEPVKINTLLETIHKPSSWDDASLLSEGRHPFQKQLALEELVAHSLSAQTRHALETNPDAFSLNFDKSLHKTFTDTLPFSLTSAQQKVINEISNDVKSLKAMRRLVQGDVGSGKTLVAASVALQTIKAGKQVALMVPTEILADQHAQNFSLWFQSFGIEVVTLLGKQSAKVRRENIEKIAQHKAGLVIGTHALFQKDVVFNNLALIIIDEQHRFGVHQRLALSQKADNKVPHQLIMTATPIPRSLAMTIYGDLDSSVIDELPPGRTPVKTVLIDNQRRQEVVTRVNAACSKKETTESSHFANKQTVVQAYWVCTLIEESESLQAKAAEDLLEELQEQLPNLKLALIHGRLKSQEKAQTIEAFRQGNIDILIATTVIEVGVDIPNASVMVIENPERLGLAQLHQLRGRVGRGAKESFCVLLYESPLGKIAKQRLAVMRDSNDGFVIAEKDLAIRGPGEVMGTKQAGMALFKVADLLRDADLLEQAKALADQVLQINPEQVPLFLDRWLGDKQHYGDVG